MVPWRSRASGPPADRSINETGSTTEKFGFMTSKVSEFVRGLLGRSADSNEGNPAAMERSEGQNPVAPEDDLCPLDVSERVTYSFVSAVYNVSPYLDRFLQSILDQSIDFLSSVEVILVNDGSTDSSKDICLSWVERYPNNVRYIEQKNAGQAAARNRGMGYASNDWVTFADPDDFLDPLYLQRVDDRIRLSSAVGRRLAMIATRYIFYHEKENEFSDSHPLRYRFAHGDVALPICEMGKYMQLSAATTFFRRKVLLANEIQFDARVKPSFEDGLFVNEYLLSAMNYDVAFVAGAKYFYRKRSDSSSTLDTGWQQKGRYDAQLRYGYLGLIKASLQKTGAVPAFIQRTILYDLAWAIKRLINGKPVPEILTRKESEEYYKLMEDIFRFIDEKTILDFGLAGLWFYHKVGLLALFKNASPAINIAYIRGLDTHKSAVEITYYHRLAYVAESVELDGVEIVPAVSKLRTHSIFGKVFLYERTLWADIRDGNVLSMKVNNSVARISLAGKQHRGGVRISDVLDAFAPKAPDEARLPPAVVALRRRAKSAESKERFGGCWLLMDRDTQADDNAEHLYRHIRAARQDVSLFFVLRSTSPDWQRLAKDGFRLIEFGSEEHKVALLNADHFVCSHADHYIFGDLDKAYFSDLLHYRYTFLQHGVIKDDLSNWLNKKPMDIFVTTTRAEYESIAGYGSYKFSRKETVLAGLARHDRLNELRDQRERLILIMPTWRNSLVGPTTGVGQERELNPGFHDSTYAKCWQSLLSSEKLRDLTEQYGYRVVFFPHANISPYLAQFDIPDYVTVASHTPDASIQDQFSRAALMITDYSSVAFEMAFLERPVIYYQFDADEIFGSGHIYDPGYFTYEQDGFGPVCRELPEVMDALGDILANGGEAALLYRERMKHAFAYKDGQNCARTVAAIENLDRTKFDDALLYPAELDYARRATRFRNWDGAIPAWSRVQMRQPDFAIEATLNLAVAKRHLESLDEAEALLGEADALGADVTAVRRERLALLVARGRCEEVISQYAAGDLTSQAGGVDASVLTIVAKAYRLMRRYPDARSILGSIGEADDQVAAREYAELASAEADWEDAAKRWSDVARLSGDNYSLLRLSEAERMCGRYADPEVAFRNVQNASLQPLVMRERAEFASARGNWESAVKYWTAISTQDGLAADDWLKLAKALRKTGEFKDAARAQEKAVDSSDRRTLFQERALLLSASQQWHQAVVAWKDFLGRAELRPNRDGWLSLARAQFYGGNTDAALRSVKHFEQWGVSAKSAEIRSEIDVSLSASSGNLKQSIP
jgi:glycosyltransferase involved in cell wall biosynthesis/tetratricopeptide (TPR) repeat protein